ncbi:MAG: preprotein translocase subunit SecG [Myxococcales bacterium]|nr:preprotein translocase subunit SecG [Myxococcales bacterium]
METFLTVLYVLVCLFLILVVLLQAGKGGGLGAAMGGSSQTVFGGAGAGDFMTRLTVIMASLFMFLSALLAYLSSSSDKALDAASEAAVMREEARDIGAGEATVAPVDDPNAASVPGLDAAVPAADLQGALEQLDQALEDPAEAAGEEAAEAEAAAAEAPEAEAAEAEKPEAAPAPKRPAAPKAAPKPAAAPAAPVAPAAPAPAEAPAPKPAAEAPSAAPTPAPAAAPEAPAAQ